MSLAQLNAYCDARFGPHAPQADPRPRPYDVPWMVLDSSEAQRDFAWTVAVPRDRIFDEIADYAERNPDWPEICGL